MTAKVTHRLVIAGLVLAGCLGPLAAVVLAPEPATGTPDMMARLPAYDKFKCALCHTTAAPVVGSSDLNVFGVDFQENDSLWNQTLAMLNSDDDRCLNGFELGDDDGDGRIDYPGVNVERSNPADGSDCSIAMTFETWGKIKQLFRSELPNYIEDDHLYYDWVYDREQSPHFP
jgi:hypothetical protein